MAGASAIAAATAEEVLSAIGEIAPQGTATFAEWMADQGFKEIVDGVASNMYYDLKVLEETFGTEAASQAFSEWTAKTATGAAGQSPVSKAAVKTAMKKAGDAGASAAGLLSMSLPAWVAAAAPVLGVAAGYGLYKSNPELWEKISRKLLPFCYEGTDVMPATVDADGNTYLDKDAIEALKQLFDEEGIGGSSGKTSELQTNIAQPIVVHPAGSFTTARGWSIEVSVPFILAFYSNSLILWGVASESKSFTVTYKRSSTASPSVYQSTLSLQYTYDNKTAHFKSFSSSGTGAPSIQYYGVDPDAASRWTAVYGKDVGQYPEGTSEWTGDKVDYTKLPTSQRYTSATDSTQLKDVIPVALPIDPMQSNDGELFPDPTTNSDPEAAIDPYIDPNTQKQAPEEARTDPDEEQKTFDPVAPIPFPKPNYEPEPKSNPEDDPSKEPDGPVSKIFDPIPYITPSSGTNTQSPVPDPSAVFSSVAGLISVYNPTPNELIAFSRWLWVTYQDATIDKIWNNPFDGIISLHELYSTPVLGPAMNIRSGFLTSDVTAATVPVRYTEIDCGTVVVPEWWGNYLDYSPYSKAFCYLPFIGIVELDVDDIVGHAVNIKYRVDAYNGSCIALIESAQDGYSNQIYQFSGNCSVEVPIAGGSQAAIKAGQMMASAQEHAAAVVGASGILGGLASLLSGRIASGLVEAATAGQIAEARGQAAAVQATVTAKSSVQHSGTFGESCGAMGNKKPYLIIKRPQQVVVTNYNEQYGYPAHKFVVIGECTGFLRCREVHVISPTATDEEKSLIEQLLKTGVYVTE